MKRSSKSLTTARSWPAKPPACRSMTSDRGAMWFRPPGASGAQQREIRSLPPSSVFWILRGSFRAARATSAEFGRKQWKRPLGNQGTGDRHRASFQPAPRCSASTVRRSRNRRGSAAGNAAHAGSAGGPCRRRRTAVPCPAVVLRTASQTALLRLDNAVLGDRQRHVHFHDFDLGVGFSGLDAVSGIHELPHQFTGTGAQQLRRIIFGFEETCLAVDHHPGRTDLLAEVCRVAGAVQEDEEPAVRQVPHRHLHLAAVEEESVRVWGELHRRKFVLYFVVNYLDRERGPQDVLGRHFSLRESVFVLHDGPLGLLVRLVNRSADDRQRAVRPFGGEAGRDERVQPAGVDRVFLKVFGLQQLDEVLDRGAEVAPDGNLLQSHHH
ncbi:MAG: hypothetical protein BJ554DRAFT_6310, partial [Olpidium bornovanus]